MIACYDLGRCPPTYDVVAFLALAERERARLRDEYIDLHILPGPAGGFRRDSLWPHSIHEREMMRDRVLVPLCRLLPSVRLIKVAANRADLDAMGGWGRDQYYIGFPRIVEALRASMRPLRAAQVKPDPELITFTLREADHWPLRNSRTAEWVAAAEALRARGWRVRIVRDTARAHERIPSDLPAASASVAERAGYYARAALNVGISNGPMWLSIFMGAPTLMLRPTTSAAGACYDDLFYAQHGVPRGSQLPGSPPHQRLVWEEDRRDVIVHAVEEMLSCRPW